MQELGKQQSEATIIIRRILDSFPALVCVIDRENGKILYCNSATKKIFGEDIENTDSKLLFDDEGNTHIRFIDVKQPESLVNYDPLLDAKWYRVSEFEMEWLDGRLARVVLGTDFNGMNDDDEQLVISAITDSMTGIYNKKFGIHFMQKQIQSLKDHGGWFTVSFLDLNDLKYVNDTFGHHEGDNYIMTFVEIVKQSVRASDGFVRMGGDEFLIVFPSCHRPIVENIMVTVNNKLKVICERENKEFIYSVSYGVKEVTVDSVLDADAILQEIDSKMYYMKDEYRQHKRSEYILT